MKKLLIATAAMASLTALAALESENVVGYATDQTLADYGFKQVAPMFVTTSGETAAIKLSDISMPEKADGDSIQLFDENGDVSEMLMYSRKKIGGAWTYVWENLDGDTVEDYSFPRGSSLWFCTESAVDVTFAGQVAKGATVVPYSGEYAFTQTGNSTPVAFKLSDLTFTSLADGDSIQMFDENGDVSEMLLYSRKKIGGAWTYVWEDLNGETVVPESYTFPAGQAFWLAFETEGEMTIPAAL